MPRDAEFSYSVHASENDGVNPDVTVHKHVVLLSINVRPVGDFVNG